jgi:hypothetical protein
MITLLGIPTTQFVSQPIMQKLTQYQLVPQLIKELIVDEAIADINITALEAQAAIVTFSQSQWLNSVEANFA